MSVFASETKKSLQYDELQVVIRKLSGKSLRKAREVRQIAQMRMSREMGGELVRAFQETAAAKDAVQAKGPAPTLEQLRMTRYAEFDQDDILVRGIESWSATKPLPDGIDDLDDAVGLQIFHEIVDLSSGPIDPAQATEGKG
jgi:hypothetical protein